MKKNILLASLLVMTSALFADKEIVKQQKIGYIHIQKLMDGPQALLECKERIQDLQNELQEKADKIQGKVKKMQQLDSELKNKEKNKWSSDPVREAKAEELMKLQKDIEISAQSLENYQMRMVQEIQNDIFAKIEKVVSRVAREKGYDLVLGQGALFVSNSCDITDDVRIELDKEYKAAKAAAKVAEKNAATKTETEKIS
ncbi:MAG: OmpH family outer membrane protein [Candidatus Babeliaceae bacterium]|jgi:outer membrane protein